MVTLMTLSATKTNLCKMFLPETFTGMSVQSNVDAQLPQLPDPVCRMIAQFVHHDSLPALRLASKAWHDAVGPAVQRIGKEGWLSLDQLQNLQYAVQKFPGLSSLDLALLPGSKVGQQLLKNLMPLSRLRSLDMYYSQAQLPTGEQFILQQSHLTTFRAICLEYDPEAGILDSFVHKVANMRSLVQLDLPLSNLVTDAAVQSLSCLTNLQSLRLPVSKLGAEVTGSSMTVFTALFLLTHLSLDGWPVKDIHITMMTRLAKLERIDLSMCQSLTCMCFMPLLQFPELTHLYICRGDEWLPDPIVNMFAQLKPNVKLTL